MTKQRAAFISAGVLAAVVSGISFFGAIDSLMYVPTYPTFRDLIDSRWDLLRTLLGGAVAAISFRLSKRAFGDAGLLTKAPAKGSRREQ